MIKFFQYIRWLSLGIPMGAVCVLALIKQELVLELPSAAYFALFSAVWFIYLRDHWKDALHSPNISDRRKFHHQHGNLLLGLMGISIVSGILAIIMIEPEILRGQVFLWGLVLSTFCGGYLISTQWLGKKWVKEITVAICYTTGICLVPVILTSVVHVLSMALQIFLLALLNLITFSIFEEDEDRQEGFYSIATELGKKSSKVLACLIMILLTASFAFMGTFGRFNAFVLMGTCIYASMYLFPAFFATKDRFRILGDAVFLLAALFLVF